MVEFEAKKGYACMCAGVLVTFKKGIFATNNKRVIEALKNNKNVKTITRSK